MLELIQSDNSIIKAIRDENWIYNPKVYAQIAGDFSLLHQRVLLGILEKLQDRILVSAERHKQNGEQWLPLFGNDELNDSIDFELDPRGLGVTHEHYAELSQALKDLSTMHIGFPQKKGKKTVYVFASLFSRIEMPFGDKYRTGKIRIKMDKENVNDFLSMERGYTDHVAKIAQIAKKQRTPRLYIYLSTFRYKGKEKVKYPELTEFLGIDDNAYVESHKKDNPKVKPTDNPFHKFSKVKKLILEPSRIEMDKLSAERKIDFTFTYTPLYEGGRLKGNPTHIEFVIVLGDLGQLREHDRERHNKTQAFVDNMQKWCPDIGAQQIASLTDTVDDEYLDTFIKYAYNDVRRAVEKAQPDDVAAYAMMILNQQADKRSRFLAVQRKEREQQAKTEAQKKALELWSDTYKDIVAAFPFAKDMMDFKYYYPDKRMLLIELKDLALIDLLESKENMPKYSAILCKHYGKIALQYYKQKDPTLF